MEKGNGDTSHYFPQLNYKALCTYAEGWVRKFPIIETVILYRWDSKYAGTLKGSTHYAVVLNFRGGNKIAKKLIASTGHYGVKDKNLLRDFFPPAFAGDVYRTLPPADFIDEWSLIPERSDKGQYFKKNPYWVLYERKTVAQTAGTAETESTKGLVSEVVSADVKYSFVKEGPIWNLTDAGKKTPGLSHKGFAVMHYLVSNQRKTFTADELRQEFNPSGADRVKAASLDTEYEETYETGDIDCDAILDEKTMKQIRARHRELKAELQKAEKYNDLGKKAKLQEEIDGIEELALSKEGLHHRSRRFTNEDTRSQNRYAKQIQRALKELKSYDEAAYKHFHDSLKPINSFTFRYNPVDEIDWFLG